MSKKRIDKTLQRTFFRLVLFNKYNELTKFMEKYKDKIDVNMNANHNIYGIEFDQDDSFCETGDCYDYGFYNCWWDTALSFAIRNEYYSIIRILLEYGANISFNDLIYIKNHKLYDVGCLLNKYLKTKYKFKKKDLVEQLCSTSEEYEKYINSLVYNEDEEEFMSEK